MNRNTTTLTSKSKTHSVVQVSEWEWEVTSGNSGSVYHVTNLKNGDTHCDCKWGQRHYRGECSHTIAVRQAMVEKEGRKILAFNSPSDFDKSHRKFEHKADGIIFASKIVG